jgi:hypothetical protein
MKLVYGKHVVENAEVVIEPSRLCHHDKPGRIKQLLELTVPADASNGGYAVRQLLGQDPDIGAKSVVTLEVALTQQQIERLKNITEDDLSSIRNGVNPAMIYGVRVYDSEPMDFEQFIKKDLSCAAAKCLLDGVQEDPASPFVSIPCRGCGEPKPDEQWPKRYLLHRPDPDGCVYLLRNSPDVCWRMKINDIGKAKKIDEISWSTAMLDNLVAGGYLKEVDVNELWETLAERQRTLEQSVNPSGEYLGCVQWFQHNNPNVIIRRDSHDRCTYFEHDRESVSGLAWHANFTAWVKSGQWTEITHQEAERRIEQNRKHEEPKAQEPQPGICKREQFGGGGTPSPRNCDVCLEGPCPRVIPVQPESGASSTMQEPYSWQPLPADPQMVSRLSRIAEAIVGIDWAKDSDTSVNMEVTPSPKSLTMHKVLWPGVWLYMARLDGCLELLIVNHERELSAAIPAVCLTKQTQFKTPLEWREPVLPKDYGKTVWWHDPEAVDQQPFHQSGRLVGAADSGSVFVIEPHDKSVAAGRSVYRRKQFVFIVDGPTEGF